MTVNDLWGEALKGCKKADGAVISLSALRGKRLAVDVSVWLHKLCCIDSVVLCLQSTPKYLPKDLFGTLQYWHETLTRCGVSVLYVFDVRYSARKTRRRIQQSKRMAE